VVVREVSPHPRRSPEWVWWCTPVIPALRRLRQDAHEIEASLGFIVHCFSMFRLSEIHECHMLFEAFIWFRVEFTKPMSIEILQSLSKLRQPLSTCIPHSGAPR
jgi:hypothetical protein